MDTYEYFYKKKLVALEDLSVIVYRLKSEGKKIVLTNGCFDILHKGHIHYLREAKGLGDVLIVGLNSDDSVRRLKGKARPINMELDRAYVMEALDFVDYITIFNTDTPYTLIRTLKPDYYVKSGDYNRENMVGPRQGAEIVERYGGKAVLLDFVEGYSTTGILKRI